MIVAVGIDIVEIARVRAAMARHPRRFLARCFHPDELEALASRRDMAPGLAARFAAKEAFQKVWHGSLSWRDAWVLKEGPAPTLTLSPRLQAIFDAEGLRCHLSLTHAREHAAAVVILERASLPAPVAAGGAS